MSAQRVQYLVCRCGGEMSPVSWFEDAYLRRATIFECSMCIHQVVVKE